MVTNDLSTLKLVFMGIVVESSEPLALLAEIAVVAMTGGTSFLAAFAAVQSAITLTTSLFGFVVSVTMSHVGHAVGQQDYVLVGERTRIALIAAACAAILSSLSLWVLSETLWAFMGLKRDIVELLRPFFAVRVLIVLPIFMQRVSMGLLTGFQRLPALATACFLTAGLRVAFAWVALVRLAGGLQLAAAAAVASTALGSVAMLILVFVSLPPGAEAAEICSGCCPFISRIRKNGGRGKLRDEGFRSAALAYIASSGDMIVRSLLLSLSVWSISVAAARIGTASLSASQVLLQLWMVTSYVCDGIADVGTMRGSKLLGEGRYAEMAGLSRRLVRLGLCVGALSGVVIAAAEDPIISLFIDGQEATDREARTNLQTVWPLLCCMQVVNSAVFVYDGLIYATRDFRFVRNLMLVGSLIIFAPLLVGGFYAFHTLLAIWGAKATLNAWRCVGAIWLIEFRRGEEWRRSECDGVSNGRALAAQIRTLAKDYGSVPGINVS